MSNQMMTDQDWQQDQYKRSNSKLFEHKYQIALAVEQFCDILLQSLLSMVALNVTLLAAYPSLSPTQVLERYLFGPWLVPLK
jgi:hypothetical protein